MDCPNKMGGNGSCINIIYNFDGTERKRRVCATDHHQGAIIPFITADLKLSTTLTGRARKNQRTLSEEDSARLLFFRYLGINFPIMNLIVNRICTLL